LSPTSIARVSVVSLALSGVAAAVQSEHGQPGGSVGVAVGVAVGVRVGRRVGVPVGVGVAVFVAVAVRVAVRVRVGVRVADGVGVTVGVEEVGSISESAGAGARPAAWPADAAPGQPKPTQSTIARMANAERRRSPPSFGRRAKPRWLKASPARLARSEPTGGRWTRDRA
jgi:hypothetical protein